MDEEADGGVGDEVEGFAGGWGRGHDDEGAGGEGGMRRAGEVGVVHEADVGAVGGAGCEV